MWMSLHLLTSNKLSPDSEMQQMGVPYTQAQPWWEGPGAPLIRNLERTECTICRLKSHHVYLFNKSRLVFQPPKFT